MISVDQIKQYYSLLEQKKLDYIVKEDIQLRILNFLSSTRYAKMICFIGGTNLRLVHGIDRFSEDLDFDIKKMNRTEFKEMTGAVESYLKNSGFKVNAKYEKEDKLKAFRCALDFPGFAYEHGLSPHKDKRFFIKIECQDQGVIYLPMIFIIKRNNYIFNLTVPPDNVLCSMKISALLSRKKGRDFYDTIFLLSKTAPDYHFLKIKHNITNGKELKASLLKTVEETDLSLKAKDFKDMVIETGYNKKILFFKDFIMQCKFTKVIP